MTAWCYQIKSSHIYSPSIDIHTTNH